MATTIRARYRNGIMEPLEPADLPEDAEIEVTIGETRGPTRSLEASLGAWEGLIDAEALLREMYGRRRAGSR